MDAGFEWDEHEARSNLRKHGVSFVEAMTVFSDPLAAIFDDPDASDEERREIIVRSSARDRLLLVAFTERQGRIRILSARRTTRRERVDHEEGTEQEGI